MRHPVCVKCFQRPHQFTQRAVCELSLTRELVRLHAHTRVLVSAVFHRQAVPFKLFVEIAPEHAQDVLVPRHSFVKVYLRLCGVRPEEHLHRDLFRLAAGKGDLGEVHL